MNILKRIVSSTILTNNKYISSITLSTNITSTTNKQYNSSLLHTSTQKIGINNTYNNNNYTSIFLNTTRLYATKIFDRELKKKHKSITAKVKDCNEFDYLRNEVANILIDRIFDIKGHEFGKVVDLGGNLQPCHVSLLSTIPGFSSFTQTNLSSDLLCRDANEGDGITRLIVDEEHLPFKENSVDLIISNLSLHWVNDLENSFKQINEALRPDGLFLASMFCDNTLNELRDCFTIVEQEREGGMGVHVSPFVQPADIGALLTSSSFTLTTIDTEQIKIHYPSAFNLMRELSLMGEGNAVATQSNKAVRPSTMFALASCYEGAFGDKETNTIPATFNILYLIGWKPHESQQKPIARGSAKHSLKDISEVDLDLQSVSSMPSNPNEKGDKSL